MKKQILNATSSAEPVIATTAAGTVAAGVTIRLARLLGGRIVGKVVKMKHPGARLTEGEKAYVRSIFGDEISQRTLNRLTKHFLPQNDKMAGSVPAGVTDMVNFHGRRFHEADYSTARDSFNRAIFIHEMTHIWQNKHPIRSRSLIRGYKRKYAYTLNEGSDFRRFGAEQQAAIMEDYALRFMFNQSSRWIRNTKENDALLKEVVESQFPTARATREKNEIRPR